MSVELLNIDCLEYMKGLPDKAFDLAIVDPPYGIKRFKKGASILKLSGTMSEWDIRPSKEYFEELFRVSVNQIIWGYNYFQLPAGSSFIFWHKLDSAPSFSKGELAWTSFDRPAEYWKSVTEKHSIKSNKIHPTQKPIALYSWLLNNYTKEGDKILDTHLGSASSAIAAHKLGFDFVGTEIDADYFKAAQERFNKETKMPLFDADNNLGAVYRPQYDKGGTNTGDYSNGSLF